MGIITDIFALVVGIVLLYLIIKYGKKIYTVLMTVIGVSIYSFIQLGLLFLLGIIWLYCVIYVLSEIGQFFRYGFSSFNWIGLLVAIVVFYLSTKKIKNTCLPAIKQIMNYVKKPINKQASYTFKKTSSQKTKIYPNSSDILKYKIEIVDSYTGYEFEEYLVILLIALGFKNVKRVGGSGDRGVDIIATRSNLKYGFQAKRYDKNSFVGNKAVQEIYTGVTVRGLDRGIVVAPAKYSSDAIGTALQTNIELWNRETLSQHLTDIYSNIEYRDHSLTSKVGYKEESTDKKSDVLSNEQVLALKPYLEILDFTCNGEISKQDIKNRYKKLVKIHHPDSIDGNEKMFKLVKNAYTEIMSSFS